MSVTLDAAVNRLVLDSCSVTAAEIPNVAAGTYTITLTASTLSKGSVSGTPQMPAVDPYVIVNVPLPAAAPQEHRRFFMLNGVGGNASFTLAAPATIRVMFVDADSDFNNGEATVTVNPGGLTTTVSALNNVLRWGTQGCSGNPYNLTVTNRPHRVTLVSSTISSGSGLEDDFVLVRLPSEMPTDAYRWVMLNGVGATHDFTPFGSETMRFFAISASGTTGSAMLSVSDL